MVSVKTLFTGPQVTFDNHLEVHSVIAHSEKLLPIVDAVSKYIKSKHKRGRSAEEVVAKLEKLEAVYVHVPEVHRAFHIAREENNLPSSRVLNGSAQPYYNVPLRSSSPTPSWNTESTSAHFVEPLPSGVSTAVHSQVDLLPTSGAPQANTPRRPSVPNSSSWRKLLPGGRRNSAAGQTTPARPSIPSEMRPNMSPSPASSVATLRVGSNEASGRRE